MKKADHPLTAALVRTLPSGAQYVPKISVRLGSRLLRTRRPKWIARWSGWFVYDSGWMSLSEDRSFGWQTNEAAESRAADEARENARWDAAIAKGPLPATLPPATEKAER